LSINFVDFLSLDVEGYELEVLKGINFLETKFKYILVETANFHEVKEFLYQFDFQFLESISYHDFLFMWRGGE
jgi:hypothetical protein